ncbi:MAG TPA: CCA tRNA nucleotidyltransferase [Candidatus Norongarragalinales archaeon]|jgi:tRNA nucleotidyltransferase (CCA-adding enzyme)|nr:CCA tRNA nucleotidyltransferase [Candidatus Norongarragalinales archaeon]
MPTIESIIENVAKQVSPTKAEAIAQKTFADKIVKKIRSKIKEKSVVVQFIGSTARDTGLRGDHDVDVFVCWPRSMKREQIVSNTFKATNSALPGKWLKHYAEHPYLQREIEGVRVEVIPCFQMQPGESIQSATDRSPLHMDYLQSRLTDQQRRDVRVLKQLLKNNGLYGAEAEIEGFSGLVCEQLILNFGSLKKLIEAAAQWRLPAIIDPEEQWKDKRMLVEKFKDAAIILVDAVDQNRNAAAAISKTNAARFVTLARALAKSPSQGLFMLEEKPEPLAELKEDIAKAIKDRNANYLLIEFRREPGLVDDILFPQLKRTALNIAKQLERHDFNNTNVSSFCVKDKCFVWLELEAAQLQPTRKILGPPVHAQKDVTAFLKNHAKNIRGPFIENERIVVEGKREIDKADKALAKIMSKPVESGIASHLAKYVKSAKIYYNSEMLKLGEETIRKIGKEVFKRDYWL